MRRRSYAIFVAMSAVAVVGLICAGCGQRSSALPPARYLSETMSDDPSTTADMSRPFSAGLGMNQGEDAGLPVGAAQSLATSAGGTWVVIASKALDPVKGLDSQNSVIMQMERQQEQPTVSDVIDAMRKAGTQITYDTTRGYVFMVFGDQTELAKTRLAPPDPVTGVYLCGPDPQAALMALADSRREHIELDPSLNDAWTAYQKRSFAIENGIGSLESGPSFQREMLMRMMAGQNTGQDRFEFSNIRRMSESQFMTAIAKQVGGQALLQGTGNWRITAFSKGAALDAELARLKSVIDQGSGIGVQMNGAGTSYAERHGVAGATSSDSSDEAVLADNSTQAVQAVQSEIDQFSQMDSSVTSAEDELGLIGAPAVPTLASYLTPSTPANVACGVLRVLASEPASVAEARSSIYKYLQAEIATPAPSGQELPRLAAIAYSTGLLSALAKADGSLAPESIDILNKVAAATDLPRFLHMHARFALMRFGNVATASQPATWNPAAELKFTLTPPPVAHGLLRPITTSPPGAIRPLATTVLPNGDAWAVFVSGRLGNAADLWLAHATGGVWTEFLFTGKRYQTSQQYSVESGEPLQPGGCVVAVAGDKVVIKPANVAAVNQMASLQAAMSKAEGSNAAKNISALATKMQALQQTAGSSLAVSYSLSLADLRKDSDGDGLTDVVEERLGTDPQSPDTTHSGIRDGDNQNPRVASTNLDPSGADRRAILQAIFGALYGSDSTVDPIVILIDKQFQQPFHGGSARVLCLTPKAYSSSAGEYSTLRCLAFGGPTDANSTILHADGPCLFSDDGNRAEVHFWISSQSQPGYAWMAQQGSDYVAILDRGADGWAIKSIDTWQFRSSVSNAMSSPYGGL